MRSYQNLPDEIMVDIFYRLPAKSIGRCRCVSKPWRALLSQPDFIRSHLTHSINRREESLLLIPMDDRYFCSAPLRDAHQDFEFDEITIPATKLTFADNSYSPTIVIETCHGLVLVGDNERNMFVWNPVTREIREVPRSPFALDPHESFDMYGFGYDSVTDDYKIVTVSYYRDVENDSEYSTSDEDEPFRAEMFVNVYSLKTGTWKRAENSPYDHTGHHNSGVFVNGYIHYIASRKPDYKSTLLAFDFVEEKFREVPPPSAVDIFELHILVVLDGCLCMYYDGDNYIWLMKEYGVQDSWTKFTIDNLEEFEFFRPVTMLGPEKIMLLEDDENLTMYDLKEGTKKDIVFDGIPDDHLVLDIFVESLVSPHGWWL